MSRSFASNFELEVAKGEIAGHKSVNKFGRNPVIAAAATADIWDGGFTGDESLIWVAPTSAVVHTIASDSASDTSGGVGARTLRVYGLTAWNAAEVNEDITLVTGSPPNTSNAYVIIHRMKVLTKGATNVNVGTITATAVLGGANVTAKINPGEGQTQMAIYGVPSTQTAYMYSWYASMNKNSGGVATGYADGTLLWNPEPDAELLNFQVKSTHGLVLQGQSGFDHEFCPQNGFTGPGIFKVQCTSATAGMDISAGFDLILVDN